MQWSSAANHIKAHDIYSESDDDLCHVRDENEEMNVFGALSLFLKSPKNKFQSQAQLQKLSH